MHSKNGQNIRSGYWFRSVLFSFFLFHISLQAYIYKIGTHGFTIFDLDTCERWDLEVWWPCPHLIDWKFIQSNAEILGWKGVMGRMPQQNLTLCLISGTSCPCAGQKPWNLSQQICEVNYSKKKKKNWNRVDHQHSEKRSKTHKRLKECFLVGRNRTKCANVFRKSFYKAM